jgi:hypothetical protein
MNHVVPNIVHQIYDYQAPNFFLFLSLLCVQRFIKPTRHVLWVNDEGRFRKGHWDSWLNNAGEIDKSSTWEGLFSKLLKNGTIEAKFITFPTHPPGNESIFVANKAHRSDFVRMTALTESGGI